MPLRMFSVLFALLLCSGCGRGNSTLYRASFYLPSESVTLAEQNRHDLLASSQLESGIIYQVPADAEKSAKDTAADDSADQTDSASLPEDVAQSVKKK